MSVKLETLTERPLRPRHVEAVQHHGGKEEAEEIAKFIEERFVHTSVVRRARAIPMHDGKRWAVAIEGRVMNYWINPGMWLVILPEQRGLPEAFRIEDDEYMRVRYLGVGG